MTLLYLCVQFVFGPFFLYLTLFPLQEGPNAIPSVSVFSSVVLDKRAERNSSGLQSEWSDPQGHSTFARTVDTLLDVILNVAFNRLGLRQAVLTQKMITWIFSGRRLVQMLPCRSSSLWLPWSGRATTLTSLSRPPPHPRPTAFVWNVCGPSFIVQEAGWNIGSIQVKAIHFDFSRASSWLPNCRAC